MTESPTNIDAILEQAMWDMFWLPRDAVVVDRPEIKYASHRRNVVYFNQVTRLRAEPSRFRSLVEEVVSAHRGRKSRWLIGPFVKHPLLESILTEHGYEPRHVHHACAIRTKDYDQRPVSVAVAPVRTMDDLKGAMQVGDKAFDINQTYTIEEMQFLLERCARPDGRTQRFAIWAGARPIASAGVTFFDDLSFGLLWGGATVEDERGKGMYSALVTARVDWAIQRGIEHVGLYAGRDSSAPIARKLGLKQHGDMIGWMHDGEK
ncbi:GNAT family N-acetyltransferase [Myxococcota bacterium]